MSSAWIRNVVIPVASCLKFFFFWKPRKAHIHRINISDFVCLHSKSHLCLTFYTNVISIFWYCYDVCHTTFVSMCNHPCCCYCWHHMLICNLFIKRVYYWHNQINLNNDTNRIIVKKKVRWVYNRLGWIHFAKCFSIQDNRTLLRKIKWSFG